MGLFTSIYVEDSLNSMPRFWVRVQAFNMLLKLKVMELLLAIITHEEIANALLPSLVKLGLSDLLVGLLSCEMGKQTDAYKLERLEFEPLYKNWDFVIELPHLFISAIYTVTMQVPIFNARGF
ncbi:hypothetical protein Taro_026054 [Colocasia esculenta]|uniref:Uncharacterized protein n=1 Tax=Colocasia esculenta TaxID=4460 RepID=A0A843VJG0_COLES|nr:hypothetical protein [Colocasia esculenta]